MYVKGRDLLLYRLVGSQYVPIACCQSCSLQLSNTVVERLPQGKWQWKECEQGKWAWTINASGLIDLGKYDLWRIVNGQILVVVASVTRGASDTATVDKKYYRKGYAVVTSLEEASDTDGRATWTIQLQGTGELTNI